MRPYRDLFFFGFIFYRGFIYSLRIYWELLDVSIFQRTLILTLAPALVLTVTKSSLSPSGSCWLLLEQSIVGEMISFIDFRISNINSIFNCFYWRSILFFICLLLFARYLFYSFFFIFLNFRLFYFSND